MEQSNVINTDSTNPNLFFPPNNILIQDNKLSLKEKKELKGSIFFYRCMNRKICNAIVHIKKEELVAFKSSDLYLIKIFKTINEHSELCTKNIKNNIEKIEIIKNIEFNLFKPFSYHYNEIKKIGVDITKNKLKKTLEVCRNQNYPNNEIYLTNIFNYKIFFNSKDFFPFCISYIKYYDFNSQKEERILFYSSIFQMNILKNSIKIFFDGTFRIVPSQYYQLLNILAFDIITKKFISVCHFIITSKTETIYKKCLYELIYFSKTLDIEIKPQNIYTDFEKSLINAINFCFNHKYILMGCWFHYLKNLIHNLSIKNIYKKKYK